MEYYRLPYKVLPRAMIDHGTMQIPVKRNMFPKKTGILNVFPPRMIVNHEVIDYNKHLRYSFGSYGQASLKNKPQSNDNRAQFLDAIYLRPSVSLQDGHNVMDLATGRVITFPKWIPCRMTKMVVKHVEEIATKQGIKSCKFYDRKGRPMIQRPIDTLLEGVGGESMLEDYEVIGNESDFPEQDLPYLQDIEDVGSDSDEESLDLLEEGKLEDLLDGNEN